MGYLLLPVLIAFGAYRLYRTLNSELPEIDDPSLLTEPVPRRKVRIPLPIDFRYTEERPAPRRDDPLWDRDVDGVL